MGDGAAGALGKPHTLYAGKGTGKVCGVCGIPVTVDEIEYEIVFADAVVLRAHVDCYICCEPGPGIGGGSADSQPLRDDASSLVLPHARNVSARKSTGNPCSVCGSPIETGDLECQLEYADAVVLRVHIACYVRSFQHGWGIGGGSADSPWTLLFDRRIALTARHSEAALSAFILACREAILAVRETQRRAVRLHAQTCAALARSRRLRG